MILVKGLQMHAGRPSRVAMILFHRRLPLRISMSASTHRFRAFAMDSPRPTRMIIATCVLSFSLAMDPLFLIWTICSSTVVMPVRPSLRPSLLKRMIFRLVPFLPSVTMTLPSVPSTTCQLKTFTSDGCPASRSPARSMPIRLRRWPQVH